MGHPQVLRFAARRGKPTTQVINRTWGTRNSAGHKGRGVGYAGEGYGGVCRGVLTDTNGLLCGAGAVSSLGGAGPCG